MGVYVNPTGIDKEIWLSERAFRKQDSPPGSYLEMVDDVRQIRKTDYLWVCLVDNGSFTAAAVVYSKHELNALTQPDFRPKRWYLIVVEDLLTAAPTLSNFI